MIFAKTADLLLSGNKTQTLRLAYPGDALVTVMRNLPGNKLVEETRVEEASGRCRWRVGGEYAIQRERCHFAIGRFRCTYLREVLDPLAVDEAFALAEGFDLENFLRVWHELHGKNPRRRCWAIGMQVIFRADLA